MNFANFLIFLVGYEADMDRLMQVNQGLRSRFSQKLVFNRFNTEDSCVLMKQLLVKEVCYCCCSLCVLL